MIRLTFTATGQVVKYKIWKDKKKVRLFSHKTDYQWKTMRWSSLFDFGILWIEPEEGKRMKVPIRLNDISHSPKLMKEAGLTAETLMKAKLKVNRKAQQEMFEAESMTEEQLRERIIERMIDIGYELKKDEPATSDAG